MDAYTEERLSNAPRPWDKKTTALYCFSAVGLFIGLAVLFETYKWYTPQKWVSGLFHFFFFTYVILCIYIYFRLRRTFPILEQSTTPLSQLSRIFEHLSCV